MFKIYYILVFPLTVLFLFFIGIYRLLSHYTLGKSCNYIPTCSKYAWDSIKQFGAIIGGFYSAKRLLRCRPNVKAGIDFPKLNLLGNYKWKC